MNKANGLDSSRNRYFLLGLLGIVILVGGIETYWIGKTADRDARARLLVRTATAAATIEPQSVIALSGTEADLTNPNYLRLKELLTRLRRSCQDIRFYYLLRKADGKILFQCDSESKDSKDYSPPGDVFDEASRELWAMFETGTSLVEGPLRDQWGTWVSGLSPIVGPNGQIVAVLGADIDASRWSTMLAQERLKPILITLLLSTVLILLSVMESRKRKSRKSIARIVAEQALLLDTIETQVWYLTDQETYGAVNDAHAAFLGRPRTVLEHKRLREVLSEREAQSWIEGNRKVLEEKRPIRAEEWMTNIRNEKRLLAIIRTPKLTAAGEVEYVVCSAEDITEHKLAEEKISKLNEELEQRVVLRTAQLEAANAALKKENTERRHAEESLRQSEVKYRRLYETMTDAFAKVDMSGHIMEVNLAYCEMTGYTAEELTRLTYEDMTPARWHAAEEKIIADQVLQNGFSEVYEKEYRRKDGSIIPVELRAFLMREENGEPAAMWAIVRDITERKALDAQMLQHEKLESIGQLAAGIAHEINTPTQYIGDHARFLKEGLQDMEPLLRKYDELIQAARAGKIPETLPDEIAALQKKADLDYFRKQAPKAIDQALEGVTRVATIVRAMKEFSHPGPAEMTPTNLNRAIESTVTVCRNEWKYVADLQTDFDESLPPVTCIPGEINQVILNMVVNAAHAIGDVLGKSPMQKGRITIQTRVEGDTVKISISDTGTGIPEEHRSRIFDPFFTTKAVGKGTGQGLTIAYNVIVKKHGGKLDFDTEVGKGTTFHIRLPLAGPEKHT